MDNIYFLNNQKNNIYINLDNIFVLMDNIFNNGGQYLSNRRKIIFMNKNMILQNHKYCPPKKKKHKRWTIFFLNHIYVQMDNIYKKVDINIVHF